MFLCHGGGPSLGTSSRNMAGAQVLKQMCESVQHLVRVEVNKFKVPIKHGKGAVYGPIRTPSPVSCCQVIGRGVALLGGILENIHEMDWGMATFGEGWGDG